MPAHNFRGAIQSSVGMFHILSIYCKCHIEKEKEKFKILVLNEFHHKEIRLRIGRAMFFLPNIQK